MNIKFIGRSSSTSTEKYFNEIISLKPILVLLNFFFFFIKHESRDRRQFWLGFRKRIVQRTHGSAAERRVRFRRHRFIHPSWPNDGRRLHRGHVLQTVSRKYNNITTTRTFSRPTYLCTARRRLYRRLFPTRVGGPCAATVFRGCTNANTSLSEIWMPFCSERYYSRCARGTTKKRAVSKVQTTLLYYRNVTS